MMQDLQASSGCARGNLTVPERKSMPALTDAAEANINYASKRAAFRVFPFVGVTYELYGLQV